MNIYSVLGYLPGNCDPLPEQRFLVLMISLLIQLSGQLISLENNILFCSKNRYRYCSKMI